LSFPQFEQIFLNPRRAIADSWRRPKGSGGGDLGLRIRRLGDDFEPVDELHTMDDIWQVVVAVWT
jgi:hypothetical protein